MELRLDGKAALITGGSRGIGQEIAKVYAEAGAQVMITSRKADVCEAAAAEIGHGVRWFASNVADPAQAEACVDATLDAFGRLDVLVNNAGTNPYAGPTIDVDLPRWDKTFQVNVTAPLLWTQLAWNKHMKQSDGGCSVVNVSSIAAFGTSELLGVYAVTKAALVHLTKQLAAELGPNVRVNSIAPGLVKTRFSQLLWEDDRDVEVARQYPLQRLGETVDIAGASLYFAAETGSWITGQTLVLDGGGQIGF